MKRACIVKRFVVGPLQTNCYLLEDPATKDACLIDPGANPKEIRRFISDGGLCLKYIINTHGHGDHIAANAFFNVPIYIHKLEEDFLVDPDKNMSRMFMGGIVSPRADRLLADGEILPLGELKLKILHTPGHSPGSVSIVVNGIAFTGDALFAGSIGRTDFDNGDADLLYRSIMQKLMALPDDTVIYPGHGPESTIGEERRSNPFLQ